MINFPRTALPRAGRGKLRRSAGHAMIRSKPLRRFFIMIAAALLAPATAMAEPIADFYHGKTISLYVSFPPGGGYDITRASWCRISPAIFRAIRRS